MTYTPTDILDYVINNDLESAFMASMLMHKGNYSIAEIGDGKFINRNEKVRLMSKTYDINLTIEDPEIIAAINSGMYISTFYARHDSNYQVHFFVHRLKADQKALHEDEITKTVVQYMIIKTIIALRLDTPQKIDSYIN